MNFRICLALCAFALLANFTACGHKSPKAYPPNIEQFKEALFADQDLTELLANFNDSDEQDASSPWPLLANAATHLRDGRQSEATLALRKVLAIRGLEARVYLWTWTALRNAGEQPDPAEADKPRGVVLEVPVEGGIDTLAAFADGSARYINYSGKVIILEALNKPVNELAKDLVQAVEPLVPTARSATTRSSLPDGQERLTILTFGGNRVLETKAGKMDSRAKQPALALMLQLVQMATNPQAQK